MKADELEDNYRSNMKPETNNTKLIENLNKGLMPTLSKALTEVAGFDKRTDAAIDRIQKKIEEYQEARVGAINITVDETKTVKGIAKSITKANEGLLIELNKLTAGMNSVVMELNRAKKSPTAPVEVTVIEDRPKKWEMFIESSSGINYKITAEAV